MSILHALDIYAVSKLGSYAVVYFSFVSYLPLLTTFSILLLAIYILKKKQTENPDGTNIKSLTVTVYAALLAAYAGVCLYDISILASMNRWFQRDDFQARLLFLLSARNVAIESAIKYLLLLTVLIIMLYKRNKRLLSALFSRPKTLFRHTLFLYCANTVAILVLGFVISKAFNQPEGISLKAVTTALSASYSSVAILYLFFQAMIISISEELLFRGVIYTGLRIRIGTMLATIAASGLFVLYHYNALAEPLYGIYYFSAGLLLTFLYRQAGSLYPPAAVHATVLILPGVKNFIIN